MNIEIQEDERFVTTMRDISFRLDEQVLWTILKVDRKGVLTMIDRFPAKGFLRMSSKVPNMNTSTIVKKLLNSPYQLYFEFVNKVLLLRIGRQMKYM